MNRSPRPYAHGDIILRRRIQLVRPLIGRPDVDGEHSDPSPRRPSRRRPALGSPGTDFQPPPDCFSIASVNADDQGAVGPVRQYQAGSGAYTAAAIAISALLLARRDT